jgi:hypothetical protein
MPDEREFEQACRSINIHGRGGAFYAGRLGAREGQITEVLP